jgi:hypothetical protein
MVAMTPQLVSRALALGLFGLSTLPLSVAPATAEPRIFVISATEGYGISDCFSGKAACGKAISDAYCKSQGFAEATAFGLAADLTASISISRTPRSRADDLVIACR